jgi:WD40 repeat protein
MMIDPANMKLVQTVPHTAGLLSGCFDPAGARFLAGGTDGQIVAWDYPGFAAPQPFGNSNTRGHRGYVHLLACLPAMGQIVSAAYDRRLIWWDAASGAIVRQIETGARPLGLAASPDGRLLALVDDERQVRLFDAANGSLALLLPDAHPAETEKKRPSSVYCVAFSPDGQLVASGDRTGMLLVRDVTHGRVAQIINARKFYSDFNKLPDGTARDGEYELGGVRCLAFAADGASLLAGGMDQYNPNSAGIDGPMGLVGYDAATGAPRWELTLAQGKGYLQTALFHPAGWFIAAGGGGTAGASGLGTLCLVDPARPAEPVLRDLQMTVRALCLSPDGARLIAAGMLKVATVGQIEVWDLAAS